MKNLRTVCYYQQDDFDAANRRFAESIDVTPALVHKIAQVIKIRFPSVEILTAPYEADAQLAYLSKQNLVDAVITEDSDLLLFGAKKVIFKLGAEYLGKELLLANIFQVNYCDSQEQGLRFLGVHPRSIHPVLHSCGL